MEEQCARKSKENFESRAGVEMENDEDEEPLEAEIPRVRMNPRNPTSREKQ